MMAWRLNGLRVAVKDPKAFAGNGPYRERQSLRRIMQNRKWRLRFGYLSDLEVSRMQRGQMWALWPEEASLWVKKVKFSNHLMAFREKYPKIVGSKYFPLGKSMGAITDAYKNSLKSGADENVSRQKCFEGWWDAKT